MAKAAGFRRRYDIQDAEDYQGRLDEILAADGPVFVSVRVAPGAEGPISRSDAESARYLQTSLADWSRKFRQALSL
jgi:thiamine pyrophosphate-dependent acetolactate synthase large subunit-like protein